MVKFNQLYYKFKMTNDREEFHVSSSEEEVRAGNALSSSMPVDCVEHMTWKKKCMKEIKLYKMKLVK